MKRLIAGTAAAMIAAVLLCPCRVQGISARSAIVMDGATGRVLYEKNPDEEGLMASTTKIMTAFLVCQRCNVLDQVKIPREAVGIEGSSMYLREGEVLTVQELLYGLMLRSGNDAAVALAIYCGGSVTEFVQLMNREAQRLHLGHTRFANPNGLDHPDHFSSARDLAVLTAEAMKNPVFARTVSTRTVTAGQRALVNHNRLLWTVPGADGVKTGYTRAAGRILVSSATRENRRLIAVTMNDPDDWKDHRELLEAGFSGYRIPWSISAGQIVGRLEVVGGVQDSVDLVAAEGFSCLLAPGEKVRIVVPGPEFSFAPVVQNQTRGTASVLIDGRLIRKIPVCCGQTVEQKNMTKGHFWDGWFGDKDNDRTAAENHSGPGCDLPPEG